MSRALRGGKAPTVPVDDRDDEEFFALARSVIEAGRMRESAAHRQHGTTSTLLHCIAVAYEANGLAKRFAMDDTRRAEVVRAALLHDYYLYDWHDGESWHRLHGLRHGRFAAENARRDYPDLTPDEEDAIRRHMFPLTPVPPTSSVGWVVTLADKRCAGYETRTRGTQAYGELRAKCSRFLPDIPVDLPPAGPSQTVPSASGPSYPPASGTVR